jgi:predicted RNA-binding Zn-ribbon protein involved in translation (DUF1610 family)
MATFSNILATENGKKMAIKYYCHSCDYKCYKKYNWETHLLTSKHLKTSNSNILATENGKNGKKMAKNGNNFVCLNCGKEYIDRTGLWRHNKICLINKENENKNNNHLINFLVNENKELKNMVMEVCKQIQPNFISNTNNTINSNNKTFNLHVFLNETCKDAMNITDFVNSIQLQLSDLENVGKVGYIEGISNIIIKNLKALDIEKRPVHCTDQKREVIYVKEDNIWEKEDETNKQLRKAIKLMAHKNICMLKSFRDKYPDFDDGDSRRSNQYNKIVIEAMGGKGDNEYEKDTKIIKKIAKVVGIDKS